MFESLEETSTINVVNTLTYQHDSKIFKTILKFGFYVEVKSIMK